MDFTNIGQRFGRLTVIQEIPGSRKIKRKLECICDCGAISQVVTNNLTSGKTKSCGCYRLETNRKVGKNKTHGRKKSGTYISWSGMKYRCNDTTNERYGGRGITCCDEWEKFESFLRDMGERPEGTSIERINPDGNYEPGNCRWATSKEQQRNRRNTRYLILDGKKVPASQIAEQLGVDKAAIGYYVSVALKMKDMYGTILSP